MILPPEIITIICRILVNDGYLGAATTLFSSSRSLHDLLAPIIYPELVLTPENGDQVYAGLVLGQSRLSTRPLQEINRLWPDIEISSEPDYDDDAEGAIDGGDNSITWPSETSHRRKLNVLRNVRRLVIRDIPCASLCNGLKTFIHFLTSSQAVNASVVFPSVARLVLEENVIWQLADWQNRHCTIFNRQGPPIHPFILFLCHAMSPKEVCITYPSLLTTRKREWLCVRYGNRDLVDQIAGRHGRGERMGNELDLFASNGFSAALEPLGRSWRTEMVTVHNVVSAMVPLPRSGDLRIVFDSCQCSKEDGPTRAGCPDHVTPESRVERIVEMLKQRNERCEGRVELVGAGRVAQAGEVHTLRNLVKGKVLQSDLSDWQKDTLLFVTEDY